MSIWEDLLSGASDLGGYFTGGDSWSSMTDSDWNDLLGGSGDLSGTGDLSTLDDSVWSLGDTFTGDVPDDAWDTVLNVGSGDGYSTLSDEDLFAALSDTGLPGYNARGEWIGGVTSGGDGGSIFEGLVNNTTDADGNPLTGADYAEGSDILPGYDAAGNWVGTGSNGRSIFEDENGNSVIRNTADANGNPLTGGQYGGSTPGGLPVTGGGTGTLPRTGTGTNTGGATQPLSNTQGALNLAGLLAMLAGLNDKSAIATAEAQKLGKTGSVTIHDIKANPMAWKPMANGGGVRGVLSHVRANPGLIAGRQSGQADGVPIMSSHGEYIFDADTVSALGDGNTEAGAGLLDRMRENIRKHKRSAPLSSVPPKAKDPMTYLKGAK